MVRLEQKDFWLVFKNKATYFECHLEFLPNGVFTNLLCSWNSTREKKFLLALHPYGLQVPAITPEFGILICYSLQTDFLLSSGAKESGYE